MDMRTRCLYWVVAAAALVPSVVVAQQSALIRGIVAGADGQPVADATVTLLDQLGAAVSATRTRGNGRFSIEGVPPGTYTVFAEAPPHRSDARIVTVRTALPIDVDLTLAARIAESVVVQGTSEAPTVTTRMTIAGDALRQIPTRLPSQGVQQMLATLPGWASEDNGVLHVRGVDDGYLYVEDGVPVYDRLDTLFGIAPDPASIGTVNVLTGYIPPEYGLKSGAVIEVQSSTASRTGWAGNVDLGVGSNAQGSVRALGGGPIGTRTSLSLSVASERSERFLEPVHPDNLHNAGGVLSAEVHLRVMPSEGNRLNINITAGRSRYQVPHSDVQEEAGQDQRQRLFHHSHSLSWQRFWSDTLVSNMAIYHRHFDGALRSSRFDRPLSAHSDRQHDRLGVLAGVTYQRSRHIFKFGFDAGRLRLQEDFTFAVTDPEEAENAEISERAAAFTVESPFRFRDRANRIQWAFYAQDSIRATDRFTVDFGIRFDRTHLLIPASQWSPRVGVAYSWPGAATTLRASVNRFFQPPQPEYLLLSSSAAARSLSPFPDDGNSEETGGAEIEPERQTSWEMGVDQWFAGMVRLDAAYWSRRVRNYADPNVFFGTTIIFPNTVAKGTARGVDFRLEIPRYRGWSSYVSYTFSKVEQIGPLNGGLFLEERFLEIGPGTRFTPDHDQRHVSAAGLGYQSIGRGFSASLAMRHQSGTPLDVDEADLAQLIDRPGAELVNFETGRVKPHTVFDLTAAQTLHRSRRSETSLRVAMLNVANEDYALNFGNPFSGTHFGAPRTLRVDLRIALH